MADINVTTLSLNPDQITRFLRGRLKGQLPSAITLYRRCQFHLRELKANGDAKSSAEVWVAAENPTAGEDSQQFSYHWLKSWLAAEAGSARTTTQAKSGENVAKRDRQSGEWLAAYIDLEHTGETQVWLYGSWEADMFASHTISTSNSTSDPTGPHSIKSPRRAALFRKLYAHLRTDHIPRLPVEPPLRWQWLRDSGKIISVPYKRHNILFGSTSEHLFPYLEDDVVMIDQSEGSDSAINHSTASSNSLRSCWSRSATQYLKYVITLHGPNLTSKSPPGFHFGPLSDQHLQVMLDRTVIPRTIETLRSLVAVGLFADQDETEPVAWGVLGKEGSISSLHTESDYRGRGLAEYISTELSRLQPTAFRTDWYDGGSSSNTNEEDEDEDDDDTANHSDEVLYAHTDVAQDNVASRRVFEKLGATVGWRTGWIEIDLS